jgi:spore germination protein PD
MEENKMEVNLINRELCVGEINIIGVSSSSLFLVGDADTIQLASTFDTPAESLIIGPFVPFVPR